jgi:uncharacterized protein
MTTSHAQVAHTATQSGPELIGRVAVVTGSQATVELNARGSGDDHPTVGKFMGLVTGKALIIALITEIGEHAVVGATGGQTFRKIARLDLIGEIRSIGGASRFQRSVMEYPNIGDGALLLSENQLRLVYGTADADHAHVGDLQQNTNIGVHVDIDNLVSQHFAIVGATGVPARRGIAREPAEETARC